MRHAAKRELDFAKNNYTWVRWTLGVPNGLNVLSNLPFLAVGAFGLFVVLRPSALRPGGPFLTPVERWPFARSGTTLNFPLPNPSAVSIASVRRARFSSLTVIRS